MFRAFLHRELERMMDAAEVFKSDVFYVGTDKRRSHVLSKLVAELKPYYMTGLMSYDEYCARAAGAACMLEILQKGQTGMTMRTLEALFFNKKLITTNAAARLLPFYHPDNIYVLDGNERRTIRDFIYAGPCHYPRHLIADYDIEHWICRFL